METAVMVLGLLPFIALILLILLWRQWIQSWREAILVAGLTFGVSTVLLTELLSLFKALSLGWIVGAWAGLCGGLTWALWRSRRSQITVLKAAWEATRSLSITGWIESLGIAFIVLMLGITALVAPPNTWDAMTYHIPRIMYWQQAGSVDHYPTHFAPQLFQNPLAEFFNLQFLILSGSDRFANTMQWLSLMGCAAGVSLIARQLGAPIEGQRLSAILSITLPIGILQASSAKNDYLLAFWLICLAYNLLKALTVPFSLLSLVQIAISLGLALLTKGTAYIYAFPFGLLLAWTTLRSYRWRVWKPWVLLAGITLALNAGHYGRNWSVYGSILGPLQESDAGGSYRNEVLSWGTLVSNGLRNLGLNLGTPWGAWNGRLNALITKLHGLLGLDVNDPNTTFFGKFFVPGGLPTIGWPGNEDSASNTLHCVLILFGLGLWLWSKPARQNKSLGLYGGLLIAAFATFCLLLKWQLWNVRLHLPLFILFAAWLGPVLVQGLHPKMRRGLVVILLVAALPWVLGNRDRPWIGAQNIFQAPRLDLYFIRRPQLKAPYKMAAQAIVKNHCTTIGLNQNGEDWEYPFWQMLKAEGLQAPRLEHVNVTNASGQLSQSPHDGTQPCAIVSLGHSPSFPAKGL